MIKYDSESLYNRALERLQQNPDWEAISSDSVIESLLKTNAEMNAETARYGEYLFNESKWDSAQNRSSIVAMAGMLGYKPKRARSATGPIYISSDPKIHNVGKTISKENFLNFFKSPEGGAWKDEEINVFDENNFDLQILKATDLTARLEKQPVDFYLIVFCGHGFTDENNQIHFEVRPNTSLKLEDLLSTVANSRCLVIADSCRAIYRLQEGGRIANQRLFSTSADARNSRYSELCHTMYNKLIGLTPSTMQLVYFSNSYNEHGEYISTLSDIPIITVFQLSQLPCLAISSLHSVP